jgi:regulator of replication initiation timing
MKTILPLLSLFILNLVLSCGQKTQGNQALYDEVMKVHDEVMPKMDDIYKLKQELKKQIADSSALPMEKKKTIEATILRLDSASENMMVWMRNFNPLPDSLGEEKARAYLEEQQEKIEKVKEDMLEAINAAEELH